MKAWKAWMLIMAGAILFGFTFILEGDQWWLVLAGGILTGVGMIRIMISISASYYLHDRADPELERIRRATERVIKECEKDGLGRFIPVKPMLNRKVL
jgi:hypothetical protein